MKLGKAPKQARCYVTGNVILTFLSACSDMGKRGRQLSAIKHQKQNQSRLHHSWNQLDLHNIKTEYILIHHPAHSCLLLCFPRDQTDQHPKSWTLNKGQPWRSDWHESHTPWVLTLLPPAPVPSQPQLGEFPGDWGQSRNYEGPVSARSTARGLSWWWLSDTCPVPRRPCLAFCMFLPIAASMSWSLISQKTAVRERPGFFSPQGFSTVTGTEGDGVQCYSLCYSGDSAVSAPLSLCFSVIWRRMSPGSFAGVNNLQTLCLGLCLFSCYWTSKTSPGRGPPRCFNTLPSYIPPRTVIPTDCRTYLCLLLIPKAIQNSIYFNIYLLWPV